MVASLYELIIKLKKKVSPITECKLCLNLQSASYIEIKMTIEKKGRVDQI